jgi:hypothetical protein
MMSANATQAPTVSWPRLKISMTRLAALLVLTACANQADKQAPADNSLEAQRAFDSMRIARQDSLSVLEMIDPQRPAMILMVPRLATPSEAPAAAEQQAGSLIVSSRDVADSLGIRLYLRGPRLGLITDRSRLLVPPAIDSLPAVVFIAPNEPLRIRVGLPTLDTLHIMLREWARTVPGNAGAKRAS